MAFEQQENYLQNVPPWYPQAAAAMGMAPPTMGFATRPRHRSTPGPDHVKHRRTRSGCYTCRQRRVKCDEARPVCERCKKGGRECVYPEPNLGSKSSARNRKASRGCSPSSGEDVDEDLEILETIPDEEEGESSPQQPKEGGGPAVRSRLANISKKRSMQTMRKKFPPPKQLKQSSSKETSSSPSSTDISASPISHPGQNPENAGRSDTSRESSQPSVKWAHLAPDLRTHLEFHQEHMTHHHYFLKYDIIDFVHNNLIDLALNYPPLLSAVVGFAAFHHTLRNPNGRIQDFLGYYNRSVSLLRHCLKKGEKYSDAMILTTLQLATFEEYLGDWINLFGHQKAALEMMRDLYTPTSINKTEVGRYIFSWYARFDIFAGLLARSGTILEPEWFYANHHYYEQQVARFPTNFHHKIEATVAYYRVLSMDMANLFTKLPNGAISIDDFTIENNTISSRIASIRKVLNDLIDPQYVVTTFPSHPPLSPSDIVNPYLPGGLFKGPHHILNHMYLDLLALDLMHKSQTCLLLQQPLPPELGENALEQCRIFEAVEMWPESPEGALLNAHASLGLASVYLPKDERHAMWCRRKLAGIEQLGYIYPVTLRYKLSEFWSIPSVRTWWLPDGENLTPILCALRAFIQERTLPPTTDFSMGGELDDLAREKENIREMKGLFAGLTLSEDGSSSGFGDSPDSVGTLGSSRDSGQSPQSQGVHGTGAPISSMPMVSEESGEEKGSQIQMHILQHQHQQQNMTGMMGAFGGGDDAGGSTFLDPTHWAVEDQTWTGMRHPDAPYE
ncbi:MAG: hypothetical protein M1834_003986 [Cirrosporium novae-zelandiae]|nr:MAG: hypothetical protein M1834_003986 [Cirrosporium novae-zelandiae]